MAKCALKIVAVLIALFAVVSGRPQSHYQSKGSSQTCINGVCTSTSYNCVNGVCDGQPPDADQTQTVTYGTFSDPSTSGYAVRQSPFPTFRTSPTVYDSMIQSPSPFGQTVTRECINGMCRYNYNQF